MADIDILLALDAGRWMVDNDGKSRFVGNGI